jgi:carbamate kinase
MEREYEGNDLGNQWLSSGRNFVDPQVVMRTAVVAIGGNSLVRPGERGGFEEQRRNLLVTCEGVAAVMAAGYRVVVTHGNGPQVGDALLRSELAASQVEPVLLDVCVAETQGSIGYLLQQSLPEALQCHGVRRPVVTVVTQVLVSRRDQRSVILRSP